MPIPSGRTIAVESLGELIRGLRQGAETRAKERQEILNWQTRMEQRRMMQESFEWQKEQAVQAREDRAEQRESQTQRHAEEMEERKLAGEETREASKERRELAREQFEFVKGKEEREEVKTKGQKERHKVALDKGLKMAYDRTYAERLAAGETPAAARTAALARQQEFFGQTAKMTPEQIGRMTEMERRPVTPVEPGAVKLTPAEAAEHPQYRGGWPGTVLARGGRREVARGLVQRAVAPAAWDLPGRLGRWVGEKVAGRPAPTPAETMEAVPAWLGGTAPATRGAAAMPSARARVEGALVRTVKGAEVLTAEGEEYIQSILQEARAKERQAKAGAGPVERWLMERKAGPREPVPAEAVAAELRKLLRSMD